MSCPFHIIAMKIIALPAESPLSQTFVLKNFPISYSNGLRRALHADICTLSIDRALFAHYDSEIPAEFVAHRIGLIPIWTPLENLRRL